VIQEIGVDLVTGLELGDAVADRFRSPGNVAAENPIFLAAATPKWRAKRTASLAWNASRPD